MMPERKMLSCCLVSVVILVLAAGCVVSALGQDTSGALPSTGSDTTSAVSPSGSAAASPLGGTITSDDYVIQVDDILTIDGHQYREFNPVYPYTVAKDGTINAVFLRRVKAAGLTVRQLTDELEKRYKKYFKNLVLSVQVRSKTYVTVGEVRSPGIQPLQLKTTMLTAIARAGGFTDWADQSNVIVIRNTAEKPTRHEVDCKAILKGRTDDFPIRPNDVIWVPRKGLF